jgi:hypothetical protein
MGLVGIFLVVAAIVPRHRGNQGIQQVQALKNNKMPESAQA